jgi:cob(I)alamin adenosyltransferase
MNLLREYIREQLIQEELILQENVFKKVTSWIKEKGKKGAAAAKDFLVNLKIELSETKQGLVILSKLVKGEKLSSEDVDFIKQQTKDVISGSILLGLFVLPGGGIATSALLKIANKLGVDLKPTAFKK